MEVTVAVATYGQRKWADLARSRAIPSAEALGVPVVHVHGDTLHAARNAALEAVATEWVCHLDADDELERGYFDHIGRATADVRAPAVRFIRGSSRPAPRMPRVAGHTHQCCAGCLPHGNWLVVGSVARAGLLRQVGGWRDFAWSEDWDLWLRCHLAGATIEAVPAAVYRAHIRAGSRNRALPQSERNRVHNLILTANNLVTA